MRSDPFFLLSSADKPFHPQDGRCPVCGSAFRQGFAYLSAGALLRSDDGLNSDQPDHLQGFLRVGYHSSDPGMRGSSDVPVVDELVGGQFDLQWCSVGCMREWFLKLLREVESRGPENRPPNQV
jgi:hypothetical protein